MVYSRKTEVERESAATYAEIPDQCFYFKVVGLKPNTYHNFYVSEVDETARCQQTNKAYGTGLQTNAQGIVTFEWFRNRTTGVSVEDTDFTDTLNKANKIGAPAKQFQLKMTANAAPTQSYAMGILPVELEVVEQVYEAEPYVRAPIFANSLFPPGDPYYDEHPDWMLVPVVPAM